MNFGIYNYVRLDHYILYVFSFDILYVFSFDILYVLSFDIL